jgi:hypothetical protein
MVYQWVDWRAAQTAGCWVVLKVDCLEYDLVAQKAGQRAALKAGQTARQKAGSLVLQTADPLVVL